MVIIGILSQLGRVGLATKALSQERKGSQPNQFF